MLKANLQHYEQQLASLMLRHKQLQERQMQLPLTTLNIEINSLEKGNNSNSPELETLKFSLNNMSESIKDRR